MTAQPEIKNEKLIAAYLSLPLRGRRDLFRSGLSDGLEKSRPPARGPGRDNNLS